MEDSQELELHRPKKTEAWETSKLFESTSEKVKVKKNFEHYRNY